LTGCFGRGDVEYNKPAIYWYQKIINNVANSNLEVADESFTSLFSEHPNSIFLSESMIILSLAHISNEEYILANFYLDEYIKRFGDIDSTEFARFLKLKANFLAFKYRFRNQELLDETIKLAKAFKNTYPNSTYLHLVDTMIAKLSLALFSLNAEIKFLYEKLDETKAVSFYDSKLQSDEFKDLKHIKSSIPWYRVVFE
jgi:outer membrane protein assembly factor BamD